MEEIKEILSFNESITNIISTIIYGGASRLVNVLFKGHLALDALDALMFAIQVNAQLIANQLRFMGENNYTIFITTSTYEFIGYGTGGASYPTYKAKNISYNYK